MTLRNDSNHFHSGVEKFYQYDDELFYLFKTYISEDMNSLHPIGWFYN